LNGGVAQPFPRKSEADGIQEKEEAHDRKTQVQCVSQERAQRTHLSGVTHALVHGQEDCEEAREEDREGSEAFAYEHHSA
jgi:hypothetical protein